KYNGLISDTPLQVYMPLAQETMRDIGIVARTSVDPASIVPSIETVVHQLDKDTPAFLSRTMDSILSESIARQRISRIVCVTFVFVNSRTSNGISPFEARRAARCASQAAPGRTRRRGPRPSASPPRRASRPDRTG